MYKISSYLAGLRWIRYHVCLLEQSNKYIAANCISYRRNIYIPNNKIRQLNLIQYFQLMLIVNFITDIFLHILLIIW